jgi:PTS system glucose-specific IIB component
MGLPYSQSSRVILFIQPALRAGFFYLDYQECMMVSLKSFLHYFSQPRQPVPLSDAEKQQIQDLIQAFGGEANIVNVDACITRLRVTVNNLAIVDSQALQQQGRWVLLFLGSRCMLFSASSLMLRQLLDEHFASRK